MKARIFLIVASLITVVLLTLFSGPGRAHSMDAREPEDALPGEPLTASDRREEPTSPPPAGLAPNSVITGVSGTELALAMNVPSNTIVSATIGQSDSAAVGIVDSPLGFHFPINGSRFAILSTGWASSADLPNDSSSLSTILNGLNNSQGNDLVQFELKLAVPVGANCASFDFAFYSEEFPEYVGSSFNDTFTAEIGGTNLTIFGSEVIAPLNFAFDETGKPISVNTVSGVLAPTASTYDGMTPLRRARTAVTAGEIETFVFSVQDLGDSVWDSAVFLDNFFWSNDPACGGDVTPPPQPTGALRLYMPPSLPTNAPVLPRAAVYNHHQAPVNFQLRLQLWQGFSMLDQCVVPVAFSTAGSQLFDCHYGMRPPGHYSIWAELYQGAERIEVASQSFVVGSGYLRLRSEAGGLSNAAYAELNEARGFAVDALGRASAKVTMEALNFLGSEATQWLHGLGDFDEIGAEIAGEANYELASWITDFAAVKAMGNVSSSVVQNHWTQRIDQRTFNGRRAAVSQAEQALLQYARDTPFNWQSSWQEEINRKEHAIRMMNESARVGWNTHLTLEPPFVHKATLTEVMGRFDWQEGDLLTAVDRLSLVFLVGLVVLGIIVFLFVKIPALLATVATAGKVVLWLFPKVLAAYHFLKNAKLIAVFSIILFGALGVSDTAENKTSPLIVAEHGEAMLYLRNGIANAAPQTVTSVSLAAETSEGHVFTTATVDSADMSQQMAMQLFRGDGQIIHYSPVQPDEDGTARQEWELAAGSYWAIASAPSAEGFVAQRQDFAIEAPRVTLQLAIQDTQLVPGQEVEAVLTLGNADHSASTGPLVVSAATVSGEGLQLWFPSLAAGEVATYSYSFIPQSAGGYVLRATVGGGSEMLAWSEQAFVVGDGASMALNFAASAEYEPGADVLWDVRASSAGNGPATAELSVVTYDRSDYSVVHESAQTLTLAVSQAQDILLNVLPDAAPGTYATHLLLDGELHQTHNYLVTAEGALFVLLNVDPLQVAVAETITVSIAVQDEVFAASSAEVTAYIRSPQGSVQQITPQVVGTGVYELSYAPQGTGTYEVRVEAAKASYATGVDSAFFIADEPSLLVTETSDQVLLNVTTPLTMTVTNEFALPVVQASVMISITNGLLVSQTDENGIAHLVVHVENSEPLVLRTEKAGYASTTMQLPVATFEDTTAPPLSLIAPSITNQSSLSLRGTTEPGATVIVQNSEAPVDSAGGFTTTVTLASEGPNVIEATATDGFGNARTISHTITLDTKAPALSVTQPAVGATVARGILQVAGLTEANVAVDVNGTWATLQPNGAFQAWIPLSDFGPNQIVVTATDEAGNVTVVQRLVVRQSSLFLPVISHR